MAPATTPWWQERKLCWSPSDPSLTRESFNHTVKQKKLDVPEQMMRHASMGTKSMMGADWIPSGLVTRAIAEMLTKEKGEESEATFDLDEPSLPMSSQFIRQVPISMERPRPQRPLSAMQASRTPPLEAQSPFARQEPISLERPRQERPNSAKQASRTALQQLTTSLTGFNDGEPMAMDTQQHESPMSMNRPRVQRPKSAMQSSQTRAALGASADWNPYHLENRADWRQQSRNPQLPLRIEGMGSIASHIREGNGRVIWSEVSGFGRKGQGRVRPASAPLSRSVSMPAHRN